MRYQGGRVLVHPRVYVVFWGSEWGNADSHGMPTVDPLGVAPTLVDFFGRLGGRDDTYSSILTQYCSGAAINATSCGSRSRRIAPLAGSPLRGWWVDSSTPPAMSNVAVQEGAWAEEINSALNHFHATSPDDIVVLALPPGQQSAPCRAFHTGGQTAQHGYRPVIVLSYPVQGPYCTGMPPVCDLAAPAQCLPSAAVTVTSWASHEYAETVTNPRPTDCLKTTRICGWIVANAPVTQGGGDITFDEIADVCGTAAFVQLNGKKVAVSTLWSNSANGGRGGCVSTYISDKKQS
jgi:serine protease